MNSNTSVRLKFLGAAGTVTGSKHLLQTPELNILVDCGLFQGIKPLRELNWQPLSFPVGDIDYIILTHAHLDHCGYLPVLIKSGFKGSIIVTPPTAELVKLILLDSAKLQEEDAEHAKKEGYSKHNPPLPLYTQDDARHTFGFFQYNEDEEWITLSENIRFRFRRNGHILGSCFIEMDCYEKRIVFSGDLGRQSSIMFPPPLTPEKADFLLVESTYGNRLHPVTPAEDELVKVINDAMHKGGTLLIPSFAVGRAQELMLMIHNIKKSNRIPDVPVYLDTPMGESATEIFCKFTKWHKVEVEDCPSLFANIRMVKKLDETYRIIDNKQRKIVIAASGMLTGGRVLHYLKAYVGDRKNTILLVGFQAEGTRGRALHIGAHEIKIHGNYYTVISEVSEVDSLSAHADQGELLEWIGAIKNKPEMIFTVHGEADATYAFANKIRDTFGYQVKIPVLGEEVELFNIENAVLSGNASGN